MDVKQKAEKTVNDIKAALPGSIDEDQTSTLSKIIEDALINMMRDCAKYHGRVARECCAADEDLAHKVAKEIHLKTVALIANLQGMR